MLANFRVVFHGGLFGVLANFRVVLCVNDPLICRVQPAASWPHYCES